jgi:Putative prokaryotic signal transducing protein
MSESARDPVIIRRYADPVQAEVDRAVLEAHGIEARVLRDDAGGMLPSLHLGVDVRLIVRWEDAVRALAVLDEGEEGRGKGSEGESDTEGRAAG